MPSLTSQVACLPPTLGPAATLTAPPTRVERAPTSAGRSASAVTSADTPSFTPVTQSPATRSWCNCWKKKKDLPVHAPDADAEVPVGNSSGDVAPIALRQGDCVAEVEPAQRPTDTERREVAQGGQRPGERLGWRGPAPKGSEQSVEAAQGLVRRPHPLLCLLHHALRHLLREVVDVVLRHQHADAVHELLG